MRTHLLVCCVGAGLGCGAGGASDLPEGALNQARMTNDNGKAFVHTESEQEPIRLVREYVERDAAGERLQFTPWFFSVVEWPDEPGWDEFTVILGFEIEGARVVEKAASVSVRYDVVGSVRQLPRQRMFTFVPEARAKREIFELTLSDDRWLITRPQMNPHVSAEIVLEMQGVENLAELRRMYDEASITL